MPDDTGSKPIRKIDDATYGPSPENPAKRRLLRVKRWFLLDANRSVVAGVLLGGCFVVILLVGAFGPVPARTFLTAGVSPGSILVELLKSIVSVLVIVLSINQLVLSPGLGPVGDQRERFEQSVELRRQMEDYTGRKVSPNSPAAFLAILLDAIADQAEEITELTMKSGAGTGEERINEFADGLVDEARTVSRLLSPSQFGRFDVISAALRFAISEKVRTLRELEQATDESTSPLLSDALDELDELLEMFAISREYLKTIYIREEYISLSEGLLYTGLPAILVTYSAAQMYSPTVFPGQVFGIEYRLLFVSGAVVVSLAPLVLLISYVFRLAALSRSTLFIGPFDARRSEDEIEEPHRNGR